MTYADGGAVILERIQKGDTKAFDELVEAVWAPLCHHLEYRLGSRDLAEDAAQEALVRVWERRERWEGASAQSLVFRIARNVATDLQRRSRVREHHASVTNPSEVSPVATPEQLAIASETERRVAEAVQRLPTRRREVFELVRYGGFSYREAGDALGLSTQTIANHLSMALRELRADLHDLMGRAEPDSETKTNDG